MTSVHSKMDNTIAFSVKFWTETKKNLGKFIYSSESYEFFLNPAKAIWFYFSNDSGAKEVVSCEGMIAVILGADLTPLTLIKYLK